MKMTAIALTCVALAGFAAAASADNTAQTLPFSQNWSNGAMITTANDWSGVPGIIGYLGDNPLTTAAPRNAGTVVGDSVTTVNCFVNQSTPNTFTSGGVAEFDGIADKTIALQGSGTADFPNVQIHITTAGKQAVVFQCNLRDIDGSTDNAAQQISVQYRVGNTGSWTPVAYVADATTGPSVATLVTPINVTLPAAADNQALVEIRVLTTNSTGNDEWVGVDDINITATEIPVPAKTTTWSAIKAGK